MIWLVSWITPSGERARGFVEADSREKAMRVARRSLKPECRLGGCTEAALHQITPQSITINFPNTSEYTIF